MGRDALVLRCRVFWTNDPNQLDFVELVNPNETARILAVRERFSPEAGGVGYVARREKPGVQNLIAMDVRDRDLGRRDQEEIIRTQVYTSSANFGS